jgi:hypothetical protein
MEDPPNKRQRTTTSSNACTGPVVLLNVGGTNRNVRRSLLTSLRDASSSNPLCERLLSQTNDEHWTAQCQDGIIVDANGANRWYVDRNVDAFDDLLSYIEYGVEFLKHICKEGGLRLLRLQKECDYFTVDSFSSDVERAPLHGENVCFSVRDYVTIAAQCSRNRHNEITGWSWKSITGNEALLSKFNRRGSLAMAQVETSGVYLVFFSMHSVAVTALLPGHGYKTHDEFCHLCVFRDAMTESMVNEWTYPLLRCGAFDYRTDNESRASNPQLVTAAAADLISLYEGNQVYCQHGHGVVMPPGMDRITTFVGRHSTHREEPHAVNYMTFIKVSGSNIAKFSVVIEDASDEPTIVKWKPCNIAASNKNNTTAVVN